MLRLLGVCLALLSISWVGADPEGNYLVGVGRADCTGPSADIGMMGYASLTQKAMGIHFRLYSRAFVFESAGKMVVFVSADIGMVDQALKFKVVEALQAKYNSQFLFTKENVLLSGTHTHSGPAAYLQYLLYSITSQGFYDASFQAIVDGMVESIVRAYESRQPGKVFINKGEVLEANINRSPYSYEHNLPEWKDKYKYDVDKDMTLLRIEDANGNPLGSVNWFAVHPTSMNNTNTLISGDNKGYASMLFEKKMDPESLTGRGKFVAAFASSNLGDVSPNTKGPICTGGPDEGSDCGYATSTCKSLVANWTIAPTWKNVTAYCIAFGPGDTMEESTRIIGERQFDGAYDIYGKVDKATQQLKGDVSYVHQYLNMTKQTVMLPDPFTGELVPKSTCEPALGYGFAGGTTDGPGMFDFHQADTSYDPKNPFWEIVKSFLADPSDELIECHKPKPILLSVGQLKNKPYDWVATVVETQILQVGNLYIIGVPGELTTMAGRQLREAVAETVPQNSHVVIAGLSNVYTHYVATFEEYQVQRYEAASTLYGPGTLQAYINQYTNLTQHMGEQLASEDKPANLLEKQWSLITPIKEDTAPDGQKFGAVVEEPTEVNAGTTASVKFYGGHPRNNPMRGGTFFVVEKCEDDESSKCEVIATDADWNTKMKWERAGGMGSTASFLNFSWDIPADATPGSYRIRHFGYYKPLKVIPQTYEGSTKMFKVLAPGSGGSDMIHSY